jgi:hypothetical protein
VLDITSLSIEQIRVHINNAQLIVFDHSIVEAYKILHDKTRPNYIAYDRMRNENFYEQIIFSVFNSTKKLIYWASMADLHGILTVEFSKLKKVGIHYNDILETIDGIIWYYNGNNIVDLRTIPEKYFEKSFSRLENPVESYAKIVSKVKYEIEITHCLSNSEFVERKKKWDFYVPGVKYKTRILAEENVKKFELKMPKTELSFYWNGKVNSAILRSKFLSPRYMFRKNYLLMQYFISRSRFSFACGSGLRYFVRKFLEIPAFGSVMVAYPPLNMEDYGFIENEHYIKADPENAAEKIKDLIGESDRQKYLADNAKKLLVALHTDEKRAEQLFNALHLIHSGKITSAKFRKGQFVYE